MTSSLYVDTITMYDLLGLVADYLYWQHVY